MAVTEASFGGASSKEKHKSIFSFLTLLCCIQNSLARMKSKTPPPPQRQLMIKTKACQRLSKEVKYYQQEVVENESKLNEMKEQNKNPYDIKKFEEVLGESHMMIPDSKNRLEQALFDLASYVDSAEVKELATELAADEWFLKARELLQKEGLSVGGDNNFSEDIVEETDVSGLQEGEAF